MFFIQSILASITENIVPEYDVLITNVPTSVLENTQKRDDKYKLRGVGGEGSHITFKDKNPHDSWSAKMSFKPIKLKFKEQANIILWYTNDPIESGEFYNTNGQFVGIMAGLEFDPNSAQIILAINDGQDYSEYEELVLRETLPIEYFDAEMSLKLIYTKNNLKVEIYKGAELIHDALRFYDTSVLGDLGKGKHFSITTHYNNVEMDKGYMLNSFKAFERTENLTYRPRAKQDIKYEVNHEVENSISHMEHFMGYLTNLMGDQQGFTIASAIRRLNDDIKTEKIKIDALKDAIKAQKSVNIGEVGTKIQEMDMKMHGVIRTINDLKYFLIDLERDHDKNSKYTAFGICLCLALMITYLVLSDIISKRN